ncbi:MAG: twin-arginine translocase TatA/TatE family subunit [Solirubrobacteraceae bacterium]
MPTGLLTPTHLVVVPVVLLLVFGPRTPSPTGPALARAIREFKDALRA